MVEIEKIIQQEKNRLDGITKAISNIPSNLPTAVIAELFPGTLRGFLNEYLSGVSAREFYHKCQEIRGRGLLDFLDDGAKARFKAIVPEDLSWFNMEWFLKAIAEEHPDIVCLLLSSQLVRDEVERQIGLFKRECYKRFS